MSSLRNLESRAERGLVAAEQGWREFAEAMREIKEKEVYQEAGYRYFATYYREVWQEKAGLLYSAVKARWEALRSFEEMEMVEGGDRDLDLPANYHAARVLRHEFPDPEERMRYWREEGLPKHRDGKVAQDTLRKEIRDYKVDPDKSINDNLRDAGVNVPEPGEASSEPTVGDALTPKDWAELPSGKLTKTQRWHYDIGGLRIRARENPAQDTADCLSNADMLDSHIEAAEELSRYFAEYADILKAKKHGRLRVVGGSN